MYAVIRTGGKQYRVSPGERLEVERLPGRAEGDEVEFTPLLVVGDETVTDPVRLASAPVTARVVGEALGPKIDGFTYKNKTNQRRRWGHRQRHSVVEITAIAAP